MLNHLPNNVEENTIIVSFDVVSLYTNIPHKYGIEASIYWIEKYKPELPNRINKEIIFEGLRFILQKNYFMFDNQMYRQKSGTAMGTKVAPILLPSNGIPRDPDVSEITTKFGHLVYKFLMENWKRYLDYCFILWNHSLDMLIEFKDLLNEINENIQFTMEYNSNQLPFLDILIIKNGTNIETDIFYKPTDSKQYLLFTSCHPKHTREPKMKNRRDDINFKVEKTGDYNLIVRSQGTDEIVDSEETTRTVHNDEPAYYTPSKHLSEVEDYTTQTSESPKNEPESLLETDKKKQIIHTLPNVPINRKNLLNHHELELLSDIIDRLTPTSVYYPDNLLTLELKNRKYRYWKTPPLVDERYTRDDVGERDRQITVLGNKHYFQETMCYQLDEHILKTEQFTQTDEELSWEDVSHKRKETKN
ncbi:unnamed protein product [Mytilus coruscus]|uniref:Reverse transcriptase domain-containing protein n=1 Tax=Mytilus coruscus TaxID=42192 RepID=A0A6J8DH82_MYTCO|nr:unnamed protein product [Mytilus coruscus]